MVYVDDSILSGNDSTALTLFKTYLSSCFHMKDLGVLKYFLGLEVARSSAGFFLWQHKYSLDIVSEVGLLGCKLASSPIEQNHRLGHVAGPLFTEPLAYRLLVGRLVYLAVTRLGITYVVHFLYQFMQTPSQAHWDAALRVMRYLKGTPGQGILLRSGSDLYLSGWCDSNWAACPPNLSLFYGLVCLFGPFSHYMEDKEATYCIPLIYRSRISIYGFHYL